MKIFILSLIMLVGIPKETIINTKQHEGGCLQMDIMLVGDFSVSVLGYESYINDAFLSFANEFDLSEQGVKIGVITFASSTELVCPLTSNKTLLQKSLNGILYYRNRGTTNMWDALEETLEQLEKNGRKDYKKIIILISDGEPDYPDETILMAKEIKKRNIGICGVLLLAKKNDPKMMKELSSDFCYVETNLDNLITEMKNLDICL